MRRLFMVLVTTGALLTVGTVHAELFGMLNGRSANLSTMSDLTIEGGFITGDLGRGDYDHIGLRVNYRIIPGLVIYGDVGQSETGYRFGAFGSASDDGTSIGVGAYYQLRDLIKNFDASVKGSFHTVSGDLDSDAISVELLLSPVEDLTESGLNWYANAGIHRLGGYVDGTEPGIGGGITMPLGPGELYAGADFIDEISYGVGFRYAIK